VVVAVVLGIAMCAAAVSVGRPREGLAMLGIMLAVVGFLAIGSRFSDTVAMLGDDIHEERHVEIHRRAGLITLNILALVIVGAGIVDIARGGDGSPWAPLALVGGATYVVSLLVISRRI
jgi:high-affinity Fe2+/Pb2+ permease